MSHIIKSDFSDYCCTSTPTCIYQLFHSFNVYRRVLKISGEIISTSAFLLILGDFNFHKEDKTNYEVKHLLESFCLHQHVSGSKHTDGYTLDLVITRASEIDIISHLYITLPNIISDLSALHFKIQIVKPSRIRELIGIN